jgi:hypothetical protein
LDSYPTCPTTNYTWEAPIGWSLNGGGNTLTTTNSTVSIKAPATGSGTFNIRVRANFAGKPSSAWRNRCVQLGPPTGYISAPPMCPNQYYTLYATASPGSTFSNWTFQGDISGSGSGSSANISTYSNFNYGHVTVTVTNACGSKLLSQTFGPSGNCPNSLTAEEVSIYPNPIIDNSELTVEWTKEAEVTSVNLIDGFGKTIEVIEPKDKKVKFKFDKIPKGDYYIHLYTEDKIIKKRIIKE